MAFCVSTAFFLIFSYCLWDVEARSFNNVLIVDNGGQWGDWGDTQFCAKGYAAGFSVKVEDPQGKGDETSMNGVRLHCPDGTTIESSVAPRGEWSEVQYCPSGNLDSFFLKVETPQGERDDTSANNVKFTCEDGSELTGDGGNWGSFGSQSERCVSGAICGIQTKVEGDQGKGDDTGFNDMKLFCCSGTSLS